MNSNDGAYSQIASWTKKCHRKMRSMPLGNVVPGNRLFTGDVKPKLRNWGLLLVLVVVHVLGNPNVWQSEYRNKIIAGQSGSFRCRKRRRIEDESKLRNL